MEYNEAKDILEKCTRNQLIDRAFGDKEIYFINADDVTVAEGYIGASVSITMFDTTGENNHQSFYDDDAFLLMNCGKRGTTEYNDDGEYDAED